VVVADYVIFFSVEVVVFIFDAVDAVVVAVVIFVVVVNVIPLNIIQCKNRFYVWSVI
jgi:hypothetical protein